MTCFKAACRIVLFPILFPFAQTPKAKARPHFEFPVMPVADSVRKDAAG